MKNILLILTVVISQVPTMFYGRTERLNLSLFVERSTRIDFFFMYYAIAINFFLMAYCMHFSRGVSKKVTKFIFIVTILDLIHLAGFAKQKYGMAKIGMAVLIYFALLIDCRSVFRFVKAKITLKWQS